MSLFVEAYKHRLDLPYDAIIIDTTSRSGSWVMHFVYMIYYKDINKK